jgi:hypothetical protein
MSLPSDLNSLNLRLLFFSNTFILGSSFSINDSDSAQWKRGRFSTVFEITRSRRFEGRFRPPAQNWGVGGGFYPLMQNEAIAVRIVGVDFASMGGSGNLSWWRIAELG